MCLKELDEKLDGKLLPLVPVALWAMRLALAVIFIVHGADKLFGTFGGDGFEATAQQFEQGLGLTPGWFHAALGGGGELVGGLCLLINPLIRVGAFLIAATMAVAIVTAHLSHGLLLRDGGFEYPLTILVAALFLLAYGTGPQKGITE